MCVTFTVFRCDMVLASLYMIAFLLVLMVGSVVLARYAQARQEGNLIRLYRLAALDRRRNETRAVIRALQEVDDNAETLRILNQALKADLVRIQKRTRDAPTLSRRFARPVPRLRLVRVTPKGRSRRTKPAQQKPKSAPA